MEVCPFWKNSKKSKRSEKEIAIITKKEANRGYYFADNLERRGAG